MRESGIVHTAAPVDRYRSWGATHAGASRELNEDCFVNRPDLGLWAVADGAGGHQSGEVASARVAQALEATPVGLGAGALLAEVRQRLASAHDWLRAEGERRGNGAVVATTVVVLLAREGHYACLWAGDSRAYLLRGAELRQISRDHSLVQTLVDAGALTAAQAESHPHANVITRAVGADQGGLDLEERSGTLCPGDRLVMCSDGLSKTLSDAEIAAVMAAGSGDPADRLVAAALAAGVRDNVTALAIEILGPSVA
jgi:protein phosphatase/serine/threonine-protein phosphatase Stp1